jgi:exopolysaccharide biosynthesis predicted pyruvyltransferase EpsI
MRDKFSMLAETLKEACGNGPVYYLPNPGNFGDAMIRYATLKFFHDIKLNVRELTTSKKDWLLPILTGGTVIYGGGGGWSSLWTHSERYVTRMKRRFRVIVLPSTFERSYALGDTIVFCRDLYESQQNMPHAMFCHDMAMYLEKDLLPAGGRGIGYYFRTDKESANRFEIPAGNTDISIAGNHLTDVRWLFETINSVSVVHTDRLHVSIAAGLLGKEVHLYAGSYFKNRAVYLSSMKNCFDNIAFHE